MFKIVNKISSVTLAIVLVVSASVFVGANTGNANYSGCGGALSITKPSQNSSVSDVVRFEAEINPDNTTSTILGSDIQVKFYLDGNPIGVANSVGELKYALDWNSTSIPNGSYGLSARAFTSSTSNFCDSESLVNIIVDNDEINNVQTPKLQLAAKPQKWLGATNTATRFEIDSYFTDSSGNTSDVTESAAYEWRSTIGSVKPIKSGDRADFFSGPNASQGYVTARVFYGSLSKTISIPVTIYQQDNEQITSYPEVDSDEDFEGTETENQELTNSTASRRLVAGDEELAGCLKQLLGEARYKELTQDKKRLSFAELQKVKDCFSELRGIVPSNIAPLDPEGIRREDSPIERTTKASVNSFSNVLDESGSKVTGLVFEGEASPNQSLLLYIFSEPLVLSVEADEEGRWSYQLTDPLAPGEHEVYVAVEEDESLAVSDSFFFEIAQASASEDNPDGLSLTLANRAREIETEQNRTFLYASFGVILAASVAGTWLATHRHHSQKKDELNSIPPTSNE